MRRWQRLVIGAETLFVLALAFLNLGGASDHPAGPSSNRPPTTTVPYTILTTASTSTSTTTTTTAPTKLPPTTGATNP